MRIADSRHVRFFIKQKAAYEISLRLEFRRVLFRSGSQEEAQPFPAAGQAAEADLPPLVNHLHRKGPARRLAGLLPADREALVEIGSASRRARV